MDFGGHSSKVREEFFQIDPKSDLEGFHIRNIGKIVENNEADIRHELQGVYLNKQKQIINTGRLREEYMKATEKLSFHQELANAVKKHHE